MKNFRTVLQAPRRSLPKNSRKAPYSRKPDIKPRVKFTGQRADAARENQDVFAVGLGVGNILRVPDIADDRSRLKEVDLHDRLRRAGRRNHNVRVTDRRIVVPATAALRPSEGLETFDHLIDILGRTAGNSQFLHLVRESAGASTSDIARPPITVTFALERSSSLSRAAFSTPSTAKAAVRVFPVVTGM